MWFLGGPFVKFNTESYRLSHVSSMMGMSFLTTQPLGRPATVPVQKGEKESKDKASRVRILLKSYTCTHK